VSSTITLAAYSVRAVFECEEAGGKKVGLTAISNSRAEMWESGDVHLVPDAGQVASAHLYQLTADQFYLVMLAMGPNYTTTRKGTYHVIS